MEERTQSGADIADREERGVEMVLVEVMESTPVLNVNKPLVSRTAVDKLHRQIRDAYNSDDYERFRTLLKNQKSRAFLFNRDFEDQSLFDEILEDGRPTTAKYISLVLKYFDLQEDDFHENGETWLTLVCKSESLTNLLSFLIPDWYQPKPNALQFLPLKALFFDNISGRSLSSRLFSIIDDENYKFFHDACFRIVCQLLHELSFENYDDYEYVVDRSTVEDAAAMINEEFRDQILQVLLVYLLPTNIEELEFFQNLTQPTLKSEEAKVSLQLMFNLLKNEIHKFQTAFADFITRSKSTYGDYHTYLVKPCARLLLMIAKQKEMHNIQAFIHKAFPQVGPNPNIMTTLYETQEFQNYIIKPFEDRKFNQMVNKRLVPETDG